MHKDVHGTAARKTKPHGILPLESAQDVKSKMVANTGPIVPRQGSFIFSFVVILHLIDRCRSFTHIPNSFTNILKSFRNITKSISNILKSDRFSNIPN